LALSAAQGVRLEPIVATTSIATTCNRVINEVRPRFRARTMTTTTTAAASPSNQPIAGLGPPEIRHVPGELLVVN
jgi:hypothetical protein